MMRFILVLSASVVPCLAASRKYATGFVPDPTYFAGLDKLPPLRADEAVPAAIDWRAHGAVTPVKNQGQCGSCWAFSTTGVIEGANALATGKLESLSEQVLLDCATNGNLGCDGGFPARAAQWVVDNGGIPTESHYEHYTPEAFRCDTNRSAITDVHINKVLAVDKNEEALQAAVAKQPVSIAVYADPLQTYDGGLVSEGCGGRVDHAILLVGYNTSKFKHKNDPVDYWIVKNSWGTAWGEKGYFYLERGINGLCITSNAVVVQQGAAPPAPPPAPLSDHKCGGPLPLSKHKCGGDESCCCQKSGPLSIYCKEWTCCATGFACMDAKDSSGQIIEGTRTCGKRS